jgi:hypothetical protein
MTSEVNICTTGTYVQLMGHQRAKEEGKMFSEGIQNYASVKIV